MTDIEKHDVIVIGGGVGGLFSAAQLTLNGRKPLMLEASDKLGGRFSTIEINGYKVPTGAIAIPAEGDFHETLLAMGVDSALRIPSPAVRVRLKGKEVNAGGATWNFLFKTVTKAAAAVAESFRTVDLKDEEKEMSIDEWIQVRTKSETVRSLIQSICASLFIVNSTELSAMAFFANLKVSGASKKFGFAPHGNIKIANDLAAAIASKGGELRTGWKVVSVNTNNGRATGVMALDPSGNKVCLEANAIVSNIGPVNTTKLLAGTEFEPAFSDRSAGSQDSAMYCLTFSTSKELLPKSPGLLEFTDTQRLAMVGNMTALCPELAPPGRFMYEAMACPKPSTGTDFDIDRERALMEADLMKVLPGFEGAEEVLFKCVAGPELPASRCIPGTDPDVRTPIPNLVDAGDGVKRTGWTGTGACAMSAVDAVKALLEDEVFQSSSAA